MRTLTAKPAPGTLGLPLYSDGQPWLYWLYPVLGVLGAALLAVAGQRLRIDAEPCATMLTGARFLYLGSYALAVLLLTAAWAGAAGLGPLPRSRREPSLAATLCMVLAVHGAALLSPPFLSDDPLSYAAVGHAMATHHASAATPIGRALPAGDPFLHRLTTAAQSVGSVYGIGFDHLASLVGRLAGEAVWLHLRLYQLVGALCVVAASGLLGLAMRAQQQGATGPAKLQPQAQPDPRWQGPRAAALLGLCPLAVIEGTVNAHNDVLILFGTALFVWLFSIGRPFWALLALLSGLLTKASALLLVGPFGLYLLHGQRGLRIRWRQAAALCAGCGLVLIAALPLIRQHLHGVSALIGAVDVPYDYCTRSVECLPRVVLRFLLKAPAMAFLVGLLFRGLGAGWLLYAALRGCYESRPLRWAALGLFVYYLYFHAWAQSWYLLPLLPLLPYAERRYLPAMLTLCMSAVAYYIVDNQCLENPTEAALNNLAGALITIVPPSIVLWRSRGIRRGPAAGPGPA